MKKKNRTMIICFLTPALLTYLIMYLYPTIRTVLMSFFEVGSLTQPVSEWSFNGIENYINLFSDALFIKTLENIGKIWLFGGIGSLSVALFLAVILNSGIRFKSFYRAVIYLPNTISAIAMGTMWIQYVYSARYGLLKDIFTFLGLDSLASIQWTSTEYIFSSMLVAYCFGMVGYQMLIFLAGIDSIPQELSEAAVVDGANRFTTFTRITFPLLRGTVRTNITLWTVSTAGFFVWSEVFSPINPDAEVMTPMVYMYMRAFGSGTAATNIDIGLSAAVGIVLVVIILLSFLVTNLLIKDNK